MNCRDKVVSFSEGGRVKSAFSSNPTVMDAALGFESGT